ncbi:bifunctional 4-hydroxy-2-oxoglutarate aldolase/2-dehydro-3-deoxy-phosphogluconate aldolase [Catenovulum sp. SM1970]|uniref:bifunctional 4-hydroxy-2-oxoglutarate aldolase/2-dehydro-3-deoxy-phosphogluconate aldolase n=1 Tax=Marinifaba aquimaris TaxID=2741323 RepID=UPI001573EFD8|nr:bifunctional 4-hydroxy-2-oxoglutarate aldolase/2-dehydro-3-deoxy-phosphogluconate aldolase [Marinifaba aquimaris]NTS76973.1 bifunctional 4-hydroxy-2-oxoglutarate aldolase/2-dehydro-3-deoxy-phosphogluconate aldolase [Marinifaba aquimaris]
MSNNWKTPSSEILAQGTVVPVLVFNKLEDALPVSEALLEGGIKVLEVTLRTECAIDAIALLSEKLPEAVTGAGTIITPEQYSAVEAAGGQFGISPGLTPNLLTAANKGTMPLIPGISSISEMMTGIEHGYDCFKFFPAEAAGGVPMLKSIAGPCPQIKFCPTGGISPSNYLNYLKLPNVACVGGSWLVPQDAVAAGDFKKITELAKAAVEGAQSAK